jgi:hypothetical protein
MFWVALALAFFGFLWFENGHIIALEYLSAYLMEWSLSIDNIFVFILIFTFFGGEGEILCAGVAHWHSYGHCAAHPVYLTWHRADSAVSLVAVYFRCYSFYISGV